MRTRQSRSTDVAVIPPSMQSIVENLKINSSGAKNGRNISARDRSLKHAGKPDDKLKTREILKNLDRGSRRRNPSQQKGQRDHRKKNPKGTVIVFDSKNKSVVNTVVNFDLNKNLVENEFSNANGFSTSAERSGLDIITKDSETKATHPLSDEIYNKDQNITPEIENQEGSSTQNMNNNQGDSGEIKSNKKFGHPEYARSSNVSCLSSDFCETSDKSSSRDRNSTDKNFQAEKSRNVTIIRNKDTKERGLFYCGQGMSQEERNWEKKIKETLYRTELMKQIEEKKDKEKTVRREKAPLVDKTNLRLRNRTSASTTTKFKLIIGEERKMPLVVDTSRDEMEYMKEYNVKMKKNGDGWCEASIIIAEPNIIDNRNEIHDDATIFTAVPRDCTNFDDLSILYTNVIQERDSLRRKLNRIESNKHDTKILSKISYRRNSMHGKEINTATKAPRRRLSVRSSL